MAGACGRGLTLTLGSRGEGVGAWGWEVAKRLHYPLPAGFIPVKHSLCANAPFIKPVSWAFLLTRLLMGRRYRHSGKDPARQREPIIRRLKTGWLSDPWKD